MEESTLEDRLADFICTVSKLMHILCAHMEYFADEVVSGVKEMAPQVAFSSRAYVDFIKRFPGIIEQAGDYKPHELHENIPIFAAEMAHMFLMREGALQDPAMKYVPLFGRKVYH
ncbi:MAG: hypothetical protein QME12_04445 [Nanoarchaeota archaeon]|nr:hypothetical protein [Nanoarchaeota archaeon]